MGQSIGGIYNTQIPYLSDNADIQEAFRLYHYGAGSSVYNPLNTNKDSLQAESIAFYLNSLQTQITNVSGTLGVQSSTWTGKGALVTALAAGTPVALPVGSTNGMVLTVKSTAANNTGIEWIAPEVLLTNPVTLSYKTLDNPKFLSAGYIADSLGLPLISFPATISSAVNAITISNATTGNKPSITASGTDTNISLNLVSKGTGTVQANGYEIANISSSQIFANKTLTSPVINTPTISGPTISQATITDVLAFEGSTADAYEILLGAIDPTADRAINLPNVDGTIITTGNLSSITTVGTVTAGSFPVANLTGTTLPSAVVTSSLTTTGTISSGTWNGSVINPQYGGTGYASYTTGDILYASGTSTLTKLSPTTNGYLLTLVAGVPAWAAAPVSLPTQTGNSGKYLTTDGTTASWVTIAAGYTAPTLGSTVIASGTTISNVSGLTINGTTIPTSATLLTSTSTSINGTTIPTSGGTALVTTATSQTVSGSIIDHLTTNAQIASYSIVAGDDGKLIEINNASANTLTVPLNSAQSIPVGSQINILQAGIGQTTINPTSITTATYASGGAAAATTVVIAATNAAILAGQKITGTGFADNTYVVSVSTTTITFSPAATAQISGTLTFSIPVFATPGLKLRSQWSSATLIKRVADSRTSTNYANDTWVLIGDLTA